MMIDVCRRERGLIVTLDVCLTAFLMHIYQYQLYYILVCVFSIYACAPVSMSVVDNENAPSSLFYILKHCLF